MSSYDLRRAGARPRTESGWLSSAHSFSFGPHYQPDNLGFGPLIAHNEDLLAPGPGYPSHAHRDVEILSWVIEGRLRHTSQDGQQHLLGPGMLQLISAGSGIVHTECSDSPQLPVRLVQMWLQPAESGGAPRYQQADFNEQLAAGGLVRLAGSEPGSALPPGCPGATLSAARLRSGQLLRLPAADRLHLFICSGSIEFTGQSELTGPLRSGDAVRLVGAEPGPLRAGQPAELLVWQFTDRPG